MLSMLSTNYSATKSRGEIPQCIQLVGDLNGQGDISLRLYESTGLEYLGFIHNKSLRLYRNDTPLFFQDYRFGNQIIGNQGVKGAWSENQDSREDENFKLYPVIDIFL